jgi:hypothetical protein
MQPLAAVLRTTTVNDDTFFAAEYVAQARNVQAAVATAVVIAAGVAISAAWRSQLGRKVRNKIATAIKAE